MRGQHAAVRASLAIAVVAAAASGIAGAAPALDQIKLPAGFRIETWVEGVPQAREMALGPSGTLFVGTMKFGAATDAGKVYAVRTVNGKRQVQTLLSGLNNPNGVAIRDG